MKKSALILLVTLGSSIAFAEKPAPPTMPPEPADQCRPAVQKCLEIQENRKMKICIKEAFQSYCSRNR
jgi:hypothetical protein